MFNHEMLQGFLAQLYQEATGYLRYSPEEVKNYFNQGVCLTYGEVEYLSLIAFAQKIHLNTNDVFLDLGSGLGKICASILLGTPCKTAIGIEASLGLHEQAIKALPKLNVFLEPEEKKIHLLQGNFLSPQYLPEVQRATVVFINSTAFTSDLLDKIGEMLNKCLSIRAIFSFKPFANLTLPFCQSILIETSWDTVLGRLYASKSIFN
jgi:H3 lysine-79-specific histone-lysine N-methyltransferase